MNNASYLPLAHAVLLAACAAGLAACGGTEPSALAAPTIVIEPPPVSGADERRK